jgi:hypothetical protein
MSNEISNNNRIRVRTPEDVRRMARNGVTAIGTFAIGMASTYLTSKTGQETLLDQVVQAAAITGLLGTSFGAGYITIQTATSTYIDPDAETNTPAETTAPPEQS